MFVMGAYTDIEGGARKHATCEISTAVWKFFQFRDAGHCPFLLVVLPGVH